MPLAWRLAEDIDRTYDNCSRMKDEAFRAAIADAVDVFFGNGQDLEI